MADISRYIEKINKAKYGEEVRSSISDALTAMNEEAENAKEWATGEGTDVPGGGSVPGTENNAEHYAQQAAVQAAAAAGSAASGIAALANEAPTFSDTDVYVAGNYVMYNNSLYRFKVNHAAGAWNSSEAEQVYVGRVLGTVEGAAKSANRILTMADDAVPIDFIKLANVGIKYADGTEVSSSSFCATDYIDIRAFSKITYSRMYLTASSVNTGLAFYKDDKTYISGVTNVANQSAFSYQDYTVTVPATAAYVRCTLVKGRIGDEGDQFHISGVSKLSAAMAEESAARETGDADFSSAISDIDETVSSGVSVVPFTVVPGTAAIDYKTGNVGTSSVFYRTDYVDVRKYSSITYKRIIVTVSTSNGVAFYDADKNFLFGVSSHPYREENGYEDYTVALPENVAYARFTLRDPNGEVPFTIIGTSTFGTERYRMEIEPAIPFVGSGIIDCEHGDLESSTVFTVSDFIECEGFDVLRYTRHISTGSITKAGMCFYDENKQFIINSGEVMKGKSETAGTEERTIHIPVNAAYVRFTYPNHTTMLSNGVGNFSLTLIKIGRMCNRIAMIDGKTDPGFNLYPHKPRSTGIANVVKRAHQMSNVYWTPLAPVTRQISVYGNVTTTQYVPGVTYKGVPYAVTIDRIHSVNVDLGIDQFMSAVANVGSRMYDQTTANWGYYPYYGAVCSAFVSGALDLHMEPITKYMPNFKWFYKVAERGTFDEYDLEIGDILLKADSHVALVTGILADANGVIKWVEVSEETLGGYITSSCAVSRWNTPERLWDRFGTFDQYRYEYIDDVQYYPSDYSQVLSELPVRRNATRYVYHPFGDEALLFKSDTNTTLKISSTAYTDGFRKAIIYSNGDLVQETEITASTAEVSAPRSIAGIYRAYLENEDAEEGTLIRSKACSWTVIDGTFSANRSGTSLTLAYDTDAFVYGIQFRDSGSSSSTSNQYVPCRPVTGIGTETFEIPENATSLAVVIGKGRGTIRKSL